VSQQIGEATSIVGQTSDGRFAVITQKGKKGQEIATLDLSNNTTKTIASNVNHSPAWLNSGSVLFGTLGKSAGTGKLAIYELAANKTNVLSFDDPTFDGAIPLYLLSPTSGFVTTLDGNTYFVSSETNISKNIGSL
jgi:hypothetical protein